jgi:hypothetical protein
MTCKGWRGVFGSRLFGSRILDKDYLFSAHLQQNILSQKEDMRSQANFSSLQLSLLPAKMHLFFFGFSPKPGISSIGGNLT